MLTHMVLESKNGYKPFSEDSANRRLRWFIEFLKEDTWKDHPYFKIVTAWQIEDILRCAGYSWQADRVLNHLHAWMKSISLLEKGRLDKDISQKKEDIHRSEKGLNKVNLGFISQDLGRDRSIESAPGARRPGAETIIVAKTEFRLQPRKVDTLREKRIPQ